MSYQQHDPYAGYDQDQIMHDNEMLDHGNDEFGDDNDGWGVDSDLYTTKLNTGQLTQEQIEMAIRLEREIMSESSAGQSRSYQYEYTEDDGYGNGGGGAAGYAPQQLVESPEDAMRLLAQRKGAQTAPARPASQQRRPPQPAATQQRVQAPRRQYGTAQDEIRAYHELCKQYRGVQAKLSGIGEPTPAQKKKFLQNLTRGLISCLRYPVPDVRTAISKMFLDIGWDVRRNRAPAHVRQPPSGAMMQELLAKTVDFFGGRHNLPKRGKYILPPRQNSVRPRQPQQQQRSGGGGNRGYNNNRNSRQGGYNNRNNNNAKGGYNNNNNNNNNRNYRGQGQQGNNRSNQNGNQARNTQGGSRGRGGHRTQFRGNNQRRDRNGPQ